MLTVKIQFREHPIFKPLNEISISGISVCRTNDYIDSGAETALERFIAEYNYEVNILFMNDHLCLPLMIFSSTSRLPYQLMISKMSSLGSPTYRMELGLDFIDCSDTKYRFDYKGNFYAKDTNSI